MCPSIYLSFVFNFVVNALIVHAFQSEVADILEDTSGALFDLKPIMSKDLSKIDTLSKYLHEESSRNSQCLQIWWCIYQTRMVSESHLECFCVEGNNISVPVSMLFHRNGQSVLVLWFLHTLFNSLFYIRTWFLHYTL